MNNDDPVEKELNRRQTEVDRLLAKLAEKTYNFEHDCTNLERMIREERVILEALRKGRK